MKDTSKQQGNVDASGNSSIANLSAESYLIIKVYKSTIQNRGNSLEEAVRWGWIINPQRAAGRTILAATVDDSVIQEVYQPTQAADWLPRSQNKNVTFYEIRSGVLKKSSAPTMRQLVGKKLPNKYTRSRYGIRYVN